MTRWYSLHGCLNKISSRSPGITPISRSNDALQCGRCRTSRYRDGRQVKILDRHHYIDVSATTYYDDVTLIALNHTDTSLQALTHIAEHESHLIRCEVSDSRHKLMVMYNVTHTQYGPWKQSDLGCNRRNQP